LNNEKLDDKFDFHRNGITCSEHRDNYSVDNRKHSIERQIENRYCLFY